MTFVDTQPDWNTPAPPEAVMVIILAAEHAAHGRADLAAAVVADATAPADWLRIAAVRALAGLIAGPNARTWCDRLRAEAHELAAETSAPDEQVRLSLAVIALAEAYERGALGRCDELVAASEFGDRDLAHAAAVLAGHLVAYGAGDRTGEVFEALRRRHGLGSAP